MRYIEEMQVIDFVEWNWSGSNDQAKLGIKQ